MQESRRHRAGLRRVVEGDHCAGWAATAADDPAVRAAIPTVLAQVRGHTGAPSLRLVADLVADAGR